MQWISADGLSVRGGTVTSSCSVSQAGWPVRSPREGRHLQTATRGPTPQNPDLCPCCPSIVPPEIRQQVNDAHQPCPCPTLCPRPHSSLYLPTVCRPPHPPFCVPRVPKLWYHGTGQTTCRPCHPELSALP